jgi:transcriptional regulator with XRE-family HTH domain
VPTKNLDLLKLGGRIRRARQFLGYSQKDFGAKCGLDRAYFGGIETGERNPTSSTLCTICDGLRCDIATLNKGIPHPDLGNVRMN